ncbi:MAG: amidohydrolase [Clostridiales bacterium]|nr:amidohydrolase [Clostridiales bacterium]
MEKQDFFDRAKELQPDLVAQRRFLHEHAETGFDLTKTQVYIISKLTEMGYTPKPCGKAGVLVSVGRGKGKAFLLRADTDGLPIREKTGLPYACKTGNMHACGHDMHTAMLLGAAKLLKEREKDLKTPVKLLFQPAEELLEGAKDCMESGVLENPTVGGAMMLHVMTATDFPSGSLIVSSAGVSAAAADYFRIRFRGKACHGATPHLGIDALTAAAQTAIALQEISARELSIDNPAVLTIGQLNAGNAPNVIAERAELLGTLRAYDENARGYVKKRLREIAKNVATAFRVKAETEFTSGTPTLVNDGELSKFVEEQARSVFGEKCVFNTQELGGRAGGSEDFAYFSHQVPSVMVALCAGAKSDGYEYPLHHEKTRFDESVLPIGAALLASVAFAMP